MNKSFALAALNYFDSAVTAQKKVISDIVTAQKDYSAQLIEASGKAVASTAPYLSGNNFAKDALDKLNTAFVAAINNKDALKLQVEILAPFDKQVSLNRTFLKNAVDLVPAAA